MQTFTLAGDTAATLAFNLRRAGGLYSRLETTPEAIVLYESAEEWEAAHPPVQPADTLPDVLTPEQLGACFPNGEFQSLFTAISADPVAVAFLMDAIMRTDNGINRRDSRFIEGVQYFLQQGYFSAEKADYLLS